MAELEGMAGSMAAAAVVVEYLLIALEIVGKAGTELTAFVS